MIIKLSNNYDDLTSSLPPCPAQWPGQWMGWRGESQEGELPGIFSNCGVWVSSCGDNHQHLTLSTLRLLPHTSSLSFTHPHIAISTGSLKDLITSNGPSKSKILSEFPSRSAFVLVLIKYSENKTLRGETQNRDCT